MLYSRKTSVTNKTNLYSIYNKEGEITTETRCNCYSTTLNGIIEYHKDKNTNQIVWLQLLQKNRPGGCLFHPIFHMCTKFWLSGGFIPDKKGERVSIFASFDSCCFSSIMDERLGARILVNHLHERR